MAIFFGNDDVSDRTIVATEKVFAFPTMTPIVPGHVLVCPRRIIARWEDLNPEETQSLLNLVFAIKKALKKVVGASGFNVAWNEGSVAGQSVAHLHVHVVPRCPGDRGITEYEPRRFLYRPGSRAVSPNEELQDIAKKIADHLSERD